MGSGEGELGAWRRARSLWERPDGGRGPGTAGGISGRGSGAQPLTGRPPTRTVHCPRPLQDGSQAAAGGKNVLRLFVSSLPWQTLGKRKNPLKLSWCWTCKHTVQVRLGACTCMCVWARVCTCGRVCAPVHALHMHTIASKETASLERGRFFEFQLAVSTMSV